MWKSDSASFAADTHDEDDAVADAWLNRHFREEKPDDALQSSSEKHHDEESDRAWTHNSVPGSVMAASPAGENTVNTNESSEFENSPSFSGSGTDPEKRVFPAADASAEQIGPERLEEKSRLTVFSAEELVSRGAADSAGQTDMEKTPWEKAVLVENYEEDAAEKTQESIRTEGLSGEENSVDIDESSNKRENGGAERVEDFSENIPESSTVSPDFARKKSARKSIFTPVMNSVTLRRAALGFLGTLQPSGAAMKVPLLLGRQKADAAAFWLPHGGRTDLYPVRTALAMTVLSRSSFKVKMNEEKHATLQEELAACRKLREELEAEIRENEPSVRVSNLFGEEEKWDYSLSSNRAYHRCIRRMEKLERELSADSIYARMIQEQLADAYYLVAPEGVIHADEVPEGWALVWIHKDFTPEIILDAPEQP